VFAEEVLRAYAYQCAVCGFDGALGRNPVGIEAGMRAGTARTAQTRWPTAWRFCALHHVLLDLGVLAAARRIRVSSLLVARSEARQAVNALAGRPLLAPRPAPPRASAH
jgi:putative restriction endonuclease